MPMPSWSRRPAAPVAPGLPAVVRGGVAGLLVLVVGDLASLYHGRGSGLILYWVAAAAYAVAGTRAARGVGATLRQAGRDGALAAALAYLLTLPLRMSASHVPGGGGGVAAPATAVALVVAAAVGGAAATIAWRGRSGRAGAGRSQVAGDAAASDRPAATGAGAVGGRPVRAAVSVEPRWPVERGTWVAPDGRQVQYISAGPAGAPPLVLHHATPGAVGAWRGAVAAAAEAGLRVVVASRPGYAGSDPQRGRRVADAAADVGGLLDHLGADRFVTAGWATGGPHALACAALLPGRCLAAAVLAGLAPRDAAGLDWAAGMAPDVAAEYALAAAAPEDLEAALGDVAAPLRTVSPDGVAEAAVALAEADQRVLAGPFADYLAATYRAGTAAGIGGWRDDDLALVGPWGFELAGVAVPVGVWWGDEDLVVPPAHGRWLATALPLGRPEGQPGEGHLSIVPRCFGEVVAALAPAVVG